MHVTVAFDQNKHDWRTLPLRDVQELITVLHPDERALETFRGGAVVLEIYSRELTVRWAELIQSGLRWKWPDYRPHVTITYNVPETLDLKKIMPFSGVIELGPEVAVEAVFSWKDKHDEELL